MKETIYPLRKFYLITSSILSIIFCTIYILSGMQDGYFYAFIIEIFLGFIIAIPLTLIYFIFIFKQVGN